MFKKERLIGGFICFVASVFTSPLVLSCVFNILDNEEHIMTTTRPLIEATSPYAHKELKNNLMKHFTPIPAQEREGIALALSSFFEKDISVYEKNRILQTLCPLMIAIPFEDRDRVLAACQPFMFETYGPSIRWSLMAALLKGVSCERPSHKICVLDSAFSLMKGVSGIQERALMIDSILPVLRAISEENMPHILSCVTHMSSDMTSQANRGKFITLLFNLMNKTPGCLHQDILSACVPYTLNTQYDHCREDIVRVLFPKISSIRASEQVAFLEKVCPFILGYDNQYQGRKRAIESIFPILTPFSMTDLNHVLEMAKPFVMEASLPGRTKILNALGMFPKSERQEVLDLGAELITHIKGPEYRETLLNSFLSHISAVEPVQRRPYFEALLPLILLEKEEYYRIHALKTVFNVLSQMPEMHKIPLMLEAQSLAQKFNTHTLFSLLSALEHLKAPQRQDVLVAARPFLSEVDGPDNFLRLFRLVEAVPCVQQEALFSMLETLRREAFDCDLFSYTIKILEAVLGLPFEERQETLAQVLPYITRLDGPDNNMRIFKEVVALSPSQRARFLEMLSPFFHSNDSQADRLKLLQTLIKIPESERVLRVALTRSFTAHKQPCGTYVTMLQAISQIPFAIIEDFTDILRPSLRELEDSSQRSELIKGVLASLSHMPDTEKVHLLNAASPFFCAAYSYERLKIITSISKAIGTLCLSQQIDILEASKPFQEGLDNQDSRDICLFFTHVSKLPASDIKDILCRSAPLIRGSKEMKVRIDILHFMASIPSQERGALLTQSGPILEKLPYQDDPKILKKIMEIPPQDRLKVVSLAASLMPRATKDTQTQDCASLKKLSQRLLDLLLRTPQGARENFCVTLGSFLSGDIDDHGRACLVKEISRLPVEDQHYCVKSVLTFMSEKTSPEKRVALLKTVSSLPCLTRDRTLSAVASFGQDKILGDECDLMKTISEIAVHEQEAVLKAHATFSASLVSKSPCLRLLKEIAQLDADQRQEILTLSAPFIMQMTSGYGRADFIKGVAHMEKTHRARLLKIMTPFFQTSSPSSYSNFLTDLAPLINAHPLEDQEEMVIDCATFLKNVRDPLVRVRALKAVSSMPRLQRASLLEATTSLMSGFFLSGNIDCILEDIVPLARVPLEARSPILEIARNRMRARSDVLPGIAAMVAMFDFFGQNSASSQWQGYLLETKNLNSSGL